MRAVVQRVSAASVSVNGHVVGEIELGEHQPQGLAVLVGVTHSDGPDQVRALAEKIWRLRILDDSTSAADVGAPILVISQFTLYADTRKGRRPSWNAAAPGDVAEPLVAQLVSELTSRGATVATGQFGAHMQVQTVNDGPVTIIIDCD